MINNTQGKQVLHNSSVWHSPTTLKFRELPVPAGLWHLKLATKWHYSYRPCIRCPCSEVRGEKSNHKLHSYFLSSLGANDIKKFSLHGTALTWSPVIHSGHQIGWSSAIYRYQHRCLHFTLPIIGLCKPPNRGADFCDISKVCVRRVLLISSKMSLSQVF